MEPQTIAARLSAATAHEAAKRRGALPAGIKPIASDMYVCGPALPVRCPAGDNLWIHKALAVSAPGEVLVVDCGADGRGYGYWGEIMATAAIARAAAGLVITGGVRDTCRLIEMALPTFAGAVTVRGTGKDHAGDGAVGEPVRIGEVVVRRGDLVIGDADGVIVLPAAEADAIVAAGLHRDADEAAILEKLAGGALTIDVYKF
jgi:4-hydroxy-4-methyl-2-oxoglutarate aldolase